MRRILPLSLFFPLPLAVACGGSTGPGFGGNANTGGQTSSSSSSTSSSTSSTSSSTSSGSTSSSSGSTSSGSTSGGVPTDCTQANDGVGCCDPAGVLHYCDQNGSLTDQPCTGGMVCGWDPNKNYYDCVPPPGGADPSGQSPMACGSGSTSTSSSSGSTSSGATGTWTSIYGHIFGPSGTSSCVAGGGCHTSQIKGGFKCGTSKASCYSGIVASGYVVTGSGASSSPLVQPGSSPLCGSLGGNMPQGGKCVSAADVAEIKSWLANGAQND